MKLIPIFFILLAELAIGSGFFACFQDAKKIRRSFFEFNAAFAAVIFLIISLWQLPQLSLFGLCFLFAGGSFWSFCREHFVRGKIFLKLSGLTGLAFGLYTLADGSGLFRSVPGSLMWLFLLQMAAGAFLLGGVHGAMVLGHWYLLMRDLDFSHLRRASILLGALIAARALLVLLSISFIRYSDPLFAEAFVAPLLDPNQNLFFFVMRLFWGLALPGALAVMIYRCARSGSNQSATGLLYLAEVSVLIGETLAVYLKI